MDRIAYLLLGGFLMILWALFFWLRPDLRRSMFPASLVGAILGVVSEVWYLRDYWQPPSIAGTFFPWPEDLLFGFSIVGVTASLFDVCFRRTNVRTVPTRKKYFAAILLLGCLTMILGVNVLGFNSIFVSAGYFLVTSAFLIALRRDLLIPSVLTAILTVLLITPVYIVLFRYVAPGYWHRFWLLDGTPAGFMFFDSLPLTEILWYAAWGSMAGALPSFIRGTVKKPLV